MISQSDSLETLKLKCLELAKNYETVFCLDSHHQEAACGIGRYEFLIALGSKKELISSTGSAIEKLQAFYDENKGEWIFHGLAYDLKNELEKLHSIHADPIDFPALFAFVPEHWLSIDKSGKCESSIDFPDLDSVPFPTPVPELSGIHFKRKESEASYCRKVNQIREHIRNGDVYELNYCTEFFAEGVQLEPYSIYQKLRTLSPTPFSAFVRIKNKYLLGASPERFLFKTGNTLYSQPIKGTSARFEDKAADESSKAKLLESEKERAENLMITDLVRNDLARSCKTGSIQVEELFGIYSFRQVHQMISTIRGELKPEIHPVQAIANAFPMGSMTGAPKVMSMKLIEQYEETRRGWYSGALGYCNPEADFDLNVVIRSLQYNAENQYLNFEVGSAITFDSVAEDEYRECLLKAKAMLRVLNAEIA
ncbi:MAG: anthranilate synthase component I family protein [Bacteroidetes bacterium]|nr:anthranilate synthase component I family protein [Bacteroidota bacterium]